MWLEIMTIPFAIIILIFFIFWIVHEGSRWQKHSQLGVFARFIQTSPRRGFLTFFFLFILMLPATLLMMTGMWWDALASEFGPQKVDVVNIMLILFLVMAFAFPVMYGALGTWRQSRRAEAEMRVRPV